MIKLMITENEAGQRLDRFLKKYLKQAPLSVIYKIIRKDAKLNGKRAKEDTMLSKGDELSLFLSDETFAKFTKTVKKKSAKKQFKIAYEDEHILVVEKPWGLLTHGDAHEKKNTLINQVCGYLQDKGDYDPSKERTFVPSPVNRLDRNTTGLVMFGKTSEALRQLTKYIRMHDFVKKYYVTIACGRMNSPIVIEDSIERDTQKNISHVSQEGGKESKTIAVPVAFAKDYTLVEIELITGRTHQIRTHLSHKGFPLAGDAKYGDWKLNENVKRKSGITTQLLHACRLEFCGIEGTFAYLNGKNITAPLPANFMKAASSLGFNAKDLEDLD